MFDFLFFNKKDENGVKQFNWNRRFKPVNFCLNPPKRHVRQTRVKPKDDPENIHTTASNDTVDSIGDQSPQIVLNFKKSKETQNNSVGLKPEHNSEDEVTVTLKFGETIAKAKEPEKISKHAFYLSDNILTRQLSPKKQEKPGNKSQTHMKERNIKIPKETDTPGVAEIKWFSKTPSPNSKRAKLFYWRD
jgi:hypothetical protein